MFLLIFIKRVIAILKSFLFMDFFTKVYYDKVTKLPTLLSLPILGHAYIFIFGKYSSDRLTAAVLDLSKKLGSRFLLNLAGTKMFFTLHPEDAQKLFKVEGKLPERPAFDALIHYRRKVFKSIGSVPGNGPEWYHFRQGMNPLLKPGIYKMYESRQNLIAKDFITYIEKIKLDDDNIASIYEHVLRYTIEAIAAICPGVSFGCLNADMQSTNALEIIKASNNFMEGLFETKKGLPLWKLYETNGYRKLRTSHEVIHKIMNQHMLNLKLQFEENPELVEDNEPFLYSLLSNEAFSWEDKVMTAMEVFFGGIDATATVISFVLYYLAKHVDIQDKVREDILLGSDIMLKSCIKETLRLRPTSGATARILRNDENFSTYHIPQGTLVLAFASVTSLCPKFVEEPEKFNPERSVDNYISLPFGHGGRMCPGRKLAMQEIIVVVAEILRNYKISTNDVEVGMVYRMNRIPDNDISISFVRY